MEGIGAKQAVRCRNTGIINVDLGDQVGGFLRIASFFSYTCALLVFSLLVPCEQEFGLLLTQVSLEVEQSARVIASDRALLVV